jgi:hypothetical protein
MLQSIAHKSTACKDGNGTYVYTIVDTYGSHEVKFTMPFSLVVQAASLETIALHQAYWKQGRPMVEQVLNEHYTMLAKAGESNRRAQDIAFYRRVFG